MQQTNSKDYVMTSISMIRDRNNVQNTSDRSRKPYYAICIVFSKYLPFTSLLFLLINHDGIECNFVTLQCPHHGAKNSTSTFVDPSTVIQIVKDEVSDSCFKVELFRLMMTYRLCRSRRRWDWLHLELKPDGAIENGLNRGSWAQEA